MPRRRQFADLHGNRNDPTAAARMRDYRKAKKLGMTVPEYRAHLEAKNMVTPNAITHLLDSYGNTTLCLKSRVKVCVAARGEEPSCPECLAEFRLSQPKKRNDSKSPTAIRRAVSFCFNSQRLGTPDGTMSMSPCTARPR